MRRPGSMGVDTCFFVQFPCSLCKPLCLGVLPTFFTLTCPPLESSWCRLRSGRMKSHVSGITAGPTQWGVVVTDVDILTSV